jgi:hypothetical protein
MHPYKLALAATTALVASTSLSFANIIAQTVTMSALTNWGTTTNTPAFTPTDTLSLAGFNPSLGTLNSVVFTLTSTASGTIDLTNNGATPGTVNGNVVNTLKFILPNQPATVRTLVTDSNSVNRTLLAGASSGNVIVNGSAVSTRPILGSFSAFENPFSVTVGDLGQVTTSSSNGNGSATFTDTGAVTIVADFNFTPAPPPPPPPGVPEPATLALMGTGVAGLGLLRRRRKST